MRSFLSVNRAALLAVLLSTALLLSLSARGHTIRYVKQVANGTGNGTSWRVQHNGDNTVSCKVLSANQRKLMQVAGQGGSQTLRVIKLD